MHNHRKPDGPDSRVAVNWAGARWALSPDLIKRPVFPRKWDLHCADKTPPTTAQEAHPISLERPETAGRRDPPSSIGKYRLCRHRPLDPGQAAPTQSTASASPCQAGTIASGRYEPIVNNTPSGDRAPSISTGTETSPAPAAGT